MANPAPNGCYRKRRPLKHNLISEPQRRRLMAIAGDVGCNLEKLKGFVVDHWGYTSSQDIQRRHYDAIVSCVEEDRNPRKRRRNDRRRN